MKELGITKGEWIGVDYAGHYSLQIAPFYGARDLLDEDKTNEAEANMKLCCDAGNTAQKCALLPSELLKQRNGFKKGFEAMIKQRDELRERCKQLEFMIEKGLGWDDIKNDITMPHEL